MRTTFVGRDRELAELAAAMADSAEGRGGLLFVTGEAGVGKTALAARLAEHAAEHRAHVAWGRPWEGAAPYWMWSQIIQTIARDLGERGQLTPDRAAVPAPLTSDLAIAPTVEHEGPSGRLALFAAATRFLVEAAVRRPQLLILDDLPNADLPSLRLLKFLAREIGTARILLLATHRDGEASPEHTEILAELAAEAHTVHLRGLDRPHVARVVADVSGVSQPWPAKVETIYNVTAGNPLYVREVARMAAGADTLDRPGPLELTIPENLRAVMRRRLAPLSAAATQMVSAAAIVGRDFDLALVGAASRLSADALLHAVGEADTAGIVAEEPGGTGVYRFTHPLMREAVYQGLPAPARAQMHRRVGEEIERLYGPHHPAMVDEIAYHYSRSAAVGNAVKAGEYARAAGDAAMATHAYEQATSQYRRALEAARYTPLAPADHCALLRRLGWAQARAGDYTAARTSFDAAATTARRAGLAEHLAQAALGLGEPQVEGGPADHHLLTVLSDALDQLPPTDSAVRARVMARLSLELTFADDPTARDQRRGELSTAALEMARRLDDVPARALACRARWMAAWEPAGLAERRRLSAELLQLSRRSADPELELVSRARRVACAMEAGEVDAADIDLAAHAHRADHLRMPYHLWAAAAMRAARSLLAGTLDHAEGLIGHAPTLMPGRHGPEVARAAQQIALLWDRGTLDAATAPNLPVGIPPELGLAWRGLVSYGSGDASRAAADLHRLLPRLETAPRNGLWLVTHCLAASVASELDDHGAADPLYMAMVGYADHVAVLPLPHPVLCLGSVSLYLGMLAAVRRSWDEAAAHLDHAAAQHAPMRAAGLLARTYYHRARVLLRRGADGDRGAATDLLDRAETEARRLGMTGLVRACAAVRSEIQRSEVSRSEVPRAEASRPEVPRADGRGSPQRHGSQRQGSQRQGSQRQGADGPEAAEPEDEVFLREGQYWTVCYAGTVSRVRDSKGMRLLAVLLADPGREFHAVDLERGTNHAPAPPRSHAQLEGLPPRADLGDAGEMLDAQAKAAYRARIDDLRAEQDQAEQNNDPARVERAAAEIAFITQELARAVGLDNRPRRAASHAERARLNTTRAIRSAIANIQQADPDLGHHLKTTIRTGRYCAYVPDPRTTPQWKI